MSALPNRAHFDVKNTLWLEVTNFCNLRCGHCYNSSGPEEPLSPSITPDRYKDLLAQAAALGFRQVQFVGGEPLFYPYLRELIQEAVHLCFEQVEIYSNLTTIPQWLLAKPRLPVEIATSFYSDDPTVHDAITDTPGSFWRTVACIQKLLAAGYRMRAGFVEMESNAGHFDRAKAYLKGLGIEAVGCDRARQFGRAGEADKPPVMAELCGHCSAGNLSIDVAGRVSGCIMSKHWSFGSVQESDLEELFKSADRQQFSQALATAIRDREPSRVVGCEPCSPSGCEPCSPAGCAPCSPPPWCGPQRA